MLETDETSAERVSEPHDGMAEKVHDCLNDIRSRIGAPEDLRAALAPIEAGDADLRAAFEARTGLRPTDFYNWLRVDMAVRLLSDTRLDVSEIAYVSGFDTRWDMATAFEETLKVRPCAFRASDRKRV